MKNPSVWLIGLQVALAALSADAARHGALAAGAGTRDFPAGLKPRIAASVQAQGRELGNLKALGTDQQVASINYCGDSYRVTTVAGETTPFPEFNLRFKTDSSDKGPVKGRPVILSIGMVGDRAVVIFSTPAEIASFINEKC